MLAATTVFLDLAPAPTSLHRLNLIPYDQPLFGQSPNVPHHLFRRDNCPSGYNDCGSLGLPGICCLDSSVCSADANNHIACCPSGALCTGTVGGVSQAAAPTGITIAGGATTTEFQFGGQTTSSFDFFPSTTAAVLVTTTPESTVANPYFPFLYIPTAFPDAAVCSSYYTSCANEFTSCTASLGGSINAVTVAGVGGGVTVQAATASVAGTAAAATICSSLSAVGCYGLQLDICATFPGGAGATGVISGSGPGSRTRGRMAWWMALILAGAVSYVVW